MPRFQFEISVALTISALGSILVFYLTRAQEGKIHLPAYSEDSESEDGLRGHDPFDVTTPEDIIDGYPIDIDAFWAKVR